MPTLTSERLFGHQQSFRGTERQSSDPYRLLFSCWLQWDLQLVPFGVLRTPNCRGSAMDKQVCPLRSPYAVVALSHDLAVVFRHLEEVGNLHATFISVLTLAHGHNAIGNFLLSHNEEVRHLLEFALANLVAEFLTPSASAATPRSCQPASGLAIF